MFVENVWLQRKLLEVVIRAHRQIYDIEKTNSGRAGSERRPDLCSVVRRSTVCSQLIRQQLSCFDKKCMNNNKEEISYFVSFVGVKY